MNPTNIEPVTEAELARVAAERCQCGNPKCPTNVASDIARELAAARAAIKVKDAALAHIVNDGKGREVFPPSNEWHGESFKLVEAALNTHTHE